MLRLVQPSASCWRTPSSLSPCGTSARRSGCRCCSHRRSVQPLLVSVGPLSGMPIDQRRLDRHPYAAVTSLIPAISYRGCRPNAPFAELVKLSRTSIAAEVRQERKVLGE
jgi:hypothetical protein